MDKDGLSGQYVRHISCLNFRLDSGIRYGWTGKLFSIDQLRFVS